MEDSIPCLGELKLAYPKGALWSTSFQIEDGLILYNLFEINSDQFSGN